MVKAAGWIIAAVMLVATIGALLWGLGQKRLAGELEVSLTKATENNATLRQTLDEMGRRVDTATQEIRDLEARVEKLQTAEHAEAPSEEAEANEALKTMMQALQQSSPSEGEAGSENPLADMLSMFSGEEGKNMARMSAQFSVPAMYGELFKELNLPPETEAQVREILIDSMAEQVSQGFDAMNGKADSEEMRKNMEAHGQKLRAELATVLTADELAVFDEYEANKEQRMLESSNTAPRCDC